MKYLAVLCSFTILFFSSCGPENGNEENDIIEFVSQLIATPSGGTFNSPINVTLTTSTQSVKIFYSLQDSYMNYTYIPKSEIIEYTGPINISGDTYLIAIAEKEGKKSNVISEYYEFETFNVYFDIIIEGKVETISGIKYGDTIKKPENPIHSKYGTFINWYEDAEYTIVFDFNMPITEDKYLFAKWNANYNLGDIGPGNGKIYYSSINGFKMTDTNEICFYLEATISDIGVLAWASEGYTETDISGTGFVVGTGRKNTELILAIDENAPAAKACKNYTGGSLYDWFFPSMHELGYLIENKDLFGNFQNINYQTSTQNSYDRGYSVGAFNGTAYWYPKGNQFPVRAVRAF